MCDLLLKTEDNDEKVREVIVNAVEGQLTFLEHTRDVGNEECGVVLVVRH